MKIKHNLGFVVIVCVEIDDSGSPPDNESLKELVSKSITINDNLWADVEFFSVNIHAAKPYTLTPTQTARCPKCNKPTVMLSTHEVVGPAFYICHGCRLVFQLGVGPVNVDL